jgi:hypothetical protein
MDWQALVVGVLIAVAVVYLGRQTWRTWFAPSGGCGGGCSCPGKKAEAKTAVPTTLISVDELTQRVRTHS